MPHVRGSCSFVQDGGERSVTVPHTRGHERALEHAGRSAGRGAAFPAHERRLLLPVRVHGALGSGAAAVRGLHDVPRRDGRAVLARGRRREPRLLRPGDLALVPHGEGHRLVSAPGVPAVGLFDLPRELVSDRYEILRHGGGGAPTTVVCGVVRFDHPAAHQLIRLLPRLIGVDAWSSPEMEWMQSTLRFMAAEARELRPGGETVITRLADILVIQAIRSLDRARPGGADRMAGRAPRPADWPRHRARPPRSGARLDPGVAGRRGRDVALGLRGALHRSWWASRPCTT